MTDLPFQSGDKRCFIGHSITDSGRRDEHAPLGNGSVSRVTELITAKYPERQIEIELPRDSPGHDVSTLVCQPCDYVLDVV